MSVLAVVDSGAGVTVQDLGRPRFQHLGVPVSGALDPVALRLANALAGNPPGAAALEIRLAGPTLEARADSVRVALAGTRAGVEVLDGAGAPVARLPAGRSVRLDRGRRIRIGALPDTAAAILAVEGGIDVPEVYGSRAAWARGRMGGFRGRALMAGDELPLARAAAGPGPDLVLADDGLFDAGAPFRVVLGPQRDAIAPESVARFLAATWRVTRAADRMGMRLEGPLLEHVRGHDIVSDGIVTGAVQVPGNGQPIVLLAEHQTMGGYPKLAAVASADIPRLGRLRPGDGLRFAEATVAEAEAARAALEAGIARAVAAMRPAPPWLDAAALHRENLIGGVV